MVREAQNRFREWDRELEPMRQALEATPPDAAQSATEAFMLLSLRNIVASLGSLRQLIEA